MAGLHLFLEDRGDLPDLDEGDGAVSGRLLRDRGRFSLARFGRREEGQKRRLGGVLREESADPLLAGGRGGDGAEHPRVVAQPLTEPVFVPVHHRQQGVPPGREPRRAQISRGLLSGGRCFEDRHHFRPREEPRKLVLPRAGQGVPIPARQRAPARHEVARGGDRARKRGGRRDEFVGPPERHRRAPVHRFPVDADLRRGLRADQAGETLHAAVSRDDPQFHLGLPEEGVLGHDPVMGAHGEFVAAPQREAVHQGHDGEGQVLELREDGDVLPREGVHDVRGFPVELLDVRAGDEGAPGPGEDDRLDGPAADRAEGPRLPDDGGELRKEFLAQGVERIRAGERDDRHVARHPHIDEFPGRRIGRLDDLSAEGLLVVGHRPSRPVRLHEGDPLRLPHRPVQHPLLQAGKARKVRDLEVLLVHRDMTRGQETDHVGGLGSSVHVGAPDGEVALPPKDDRPAREDVPFVEIPRDEGAEVERVLVDAVHDDVGGDARTEHLPERLPQRLGGTGEAGGVFGVETALRGQRVRHLFGEGEAVAVEDVGRRHPHPGEFRDPALLPRRGGDHGDFRGACPRRRDELPRCRCPLPRRAPAGRGGVRVRRRSRPASPDGRGPASAASTPSGRP